MSETNLYTCTPRQARGYVYDTLQAGLVPFLQSSPGLGKSSIMKSIAKELGLKLIDHRLSTSSPEDLSGLPRFENGEAVFCPFRGLFPTANMPVPEGFKGWLVFLDEFNSASKAVQAAAYKLILDRQVGQEDLHEMVLVACAGNLATDRAIVNNLSTAMQSRVIHIEMRESYDDWLMDVAIPQGYDQRIIAYISMHPGKLMDFKPTHQNKTFACPRTWEFMNKLITGKAMDDKKTGLYAGTITAEVAAEFVQFTKVYDKLVKVESIIADPSGCEVPSDMNSKWATICHMLEKITDKNFGALATYADRFDFSMRILFYRSVMVRHPDLRREPAFIRSLSTLAKYLNG